MRWNGGNGVQTHTKRTEGLRVNMKRTVRFALPPVHGYPSRKEWEHACWSKLLKSKNLIASLVTHNERRNLVMRAAVIDRIHSGNTYRQIGKELWLSPQTVSSIKKAAKEHGYRSYRERGKTERKKRVYSPLTIPIKRLHGRSVRTKYGTVYLP